MSSVTMTCFYLGNPHQPPNMEPSTPTLALAELEGACVRGWFEATFTVRKEELGVSLEWVDEWPKPYVIRCY